MRNKVCLTLLVIVVLTLVPGAALFAGEPSQPPTAEVMTPATPSPATLEILPALIGETAPMSVDPTRAAEGPIAPEPASLWGICWTSCRPCHTSGDCPSGETCRFGVQCP